MGSTYKNQLCFCTLAMTTSKRKLRNNSIHNSTKKNKILGIKLTEEVQDLYTENCKMLLKEIKENYMNGKTSWAHELADFT